MTDNKAMLDTIQHSLEDVPNVEYVALGGGMGAPGVDAKVGGVVWSISSNGNWDIDLLLPEKWVLVGYVVEDDILHDNEAELQHDGPVWDADDQEVISWFVAQMKVASGIDWTSRPQTFRVQDDHKCVRCGSDVLQLNGGEWVTNNDDLSPFCNQKDGPLHTVA